MNIVSKLGRPVRLGLVSAGEPIEYADHIRRSTAINTVPAGVIDRNASAALQAVDARTQSWIAFNVRVGDAVLAGERYLVAVRWLLDSGVDAIVCTCPVQDHEMQVVGANNNARKLGVPVIVADSNRHVGKVDWEHGVVMASADASLCSDEASWHADPDHCRIGGLDRSNASAAGVVAGVALSELGSSLPRSELLDSLRAWTLQQPSRLAS